MTSNGTRGIFCVVMRRDVPHGRLTRKQAGASRLGWSLRCRDMLLVTTSKAPVTTSKAPVTTSKAPVTTSVALVPVVKRSQPEKCGFEAIASFPSDFSAALCKLRVRRLRLLQNQVHFCTKLFSPGRHVLEALQTAAKKAIDPPCS